MTRTNSKNAILENGRPEIASTEDFLCSGISRHVTTTSTRVAVIQNSLGFFEGQASAKNRIDTEPVQGVPNDAIWLGLMSDPSTSIFIGLGTEGGRLQVDNNVLVPRIEGADEEESFVWNGIL